MRACVRACVRARDVKPSYANRDGMMCSIAPSSRLSPITCPVRLSSSLVISFYKWSPVARAIACGEQLPGDVSIVLAQRNVRFVSIES